MGQIVANEDFTRRSLFALHGEYVAVRWWRVTTSGAEIDAGMALSAACAPDEAHPDIAGMRLFERHAIRTGHGSYVSWSWDVCGRYRGVAGWPMAGRVRLVDPYEEANALMLEIQGIASGTSGAGRYFAKWPTAVEMPARGSLASFANSELGEPWESPRAMSMVEFAEWSLAAGRIPGRRPVPAPRPGAIFATLDTRHAPSSYQLRVRIPRRRKRIYWAVYAILLGTLFVEYGWLGLEWLGTRF